MVGARDDPSNYRFISLLCAPAKLFTSISRWGIETWALSVNIFRYKQIGFHSDFSCMHHVLTLRTLFQQANNNGQCLCVAFIHFQKAFDTVLCYMLWKKLSAIGIRGLVLAALYSFE